MVFIKYTTYFITLLTLLSSHLYSQNFLSYTKRKYLPELATKQHVDNLRFISFDGKFTYYQRRTGQLNLSTNYRVDTILKKKPGTNYLVYSSPLRKKVLIQEDQNFHSFYGVRKLKKIYLANYGSKSIKKLAWGTSPKLHLLDRWVSYYNPQHKKIYFLNLEFTSFKFEIKLRNKINPYFIPQVVMPTDGDAYYTDLDSSGVPIVIHFNRKTNKSKLMYTGAGHQFKLELCLNKSLLIFAEFNLYNNDSLNIISTMNAGSIDFSKRKIIYESASKDTGNIICDLNNEDIFFIKSMNNDKGKTKKTEAVRLNIDSKKIKVLSNVDYATQIINMDGRLLLPYRGKYYILIGENNLATIDILDKDKK